MSGKNIDLDIVAKLLYDFERQVRYSASSEHLLKTTCPDINGARLRKATRNAQIDRELVDRKREMIFDYLRRI